MTKKELLARQAAILSKAKNEKRDLTDEEQKEFDDITAQIKALGETPETAPAAPAAHAEGSQRTAEEERQRSLEITNLCGAFPDLGLRAADYIADANATADSIRALIIEKQIKNKAPQSTSVITDEGDKLREAASDGIVLRAGLELQGENTSERAAAAGNFRGMSLERIAINALERAGVSTANMSRSEIFDELTRSYYNPSAAFPSIMDQAINKAYVAGYEQAQATYDQWVKEGTLSDFKKTHGDYVAGAAGELLEVPENGELKADLPPDYQRPERQLKTYGRSFSMTRQAFINDDIGFITTVPARYAESARRTLNKQVYELIYNNDKIYDGTALFAAVHKNLASAARPTKDSYAEMRKLIRKQTGLDGEALNLSMTHVIVPEDYDLDLREILFAQTLSDATVTGKYNPFFGDNVKVVVDDTIAVLAGTAACPWFAASSNAASIQVDYLNGQKIPTIRRSEGAGTLGFIWDIYLDWGISVIDFRGLAKNPGVVL